MAKIIQFPVKSSTAYTNLVQLIAIADSTASLKNISRLWRFAMKMVIFFLVKSKS